jgi:PAS domain S-box-containing protein
VLRYGVALVNVALAVVLGELLAPLWGEKMPFLLLYPAVMVSAWYGGLGPGLLTAALCTIAAAYFWFAPLRSLAVATLADQVGLALAALVMLLIAYLAAALQDSETRFRRMFEDTQVAMALVAPDGRYLRVNAACCALLGYPAKELLQTTVRALTHPEDWDLGQDAIRRVLAGEQAAYQIELRYRRRQDEPVWVSENATLLRDGQQAPLYFVVQMQNITVRKQAEAALQHQAEIVQHTHDAVITTDLAGRVTSWNQGAERLYGYTPEEMLGQSVLRLFPEDLRSQFLVQVLTPVRLQGRHEIELRQRCKSGETRLVHFAFSLQTDQRGAPTGLIGYGLDITARVQVEDALARHARDLERVNADLRQIAFLTSHDLLEPLRQMKIHTQRLVRFFRPGLSPDADESLTYVIEGAHRMIELLRNVQDYLMIELEATEERITDCEDVLRQVVTVLQGPIALTQAQITHDPLPTLSAAPAHLALVFRHLVDNAIKFHGDTPPRIHITVQREGAVWVFAVRDHGIGMEVPADGRLFHLFQRLQPRSAYPGTGMGLAICKKVIERHGGRIWVESTPGQGTTVFFTISEKMWRKENEE